MASGPRSENGDDMTFGLDYGDNMFRTKIGRSPGPSLAGARQNIGNIGVQFWGFAGNVLQTSPQASKGTLRIRGGALSVEHMGGKAGGRSVTVLPDTHKRTRFLHLHCSVISFRFLGFLLWLALGPGGLREAPGVPGNAH